MNAHEQILKGNFQTKRPIDLSGVHQANSLQSRLRKKVLASLGGSMVYMERKNLTWDGESSGS